MGSIYSISRSGTQVIDELKQEKIPGLKHVHKPLDERGMHSLWPDGVTDGTNCAWFENDMLLTWGRNDPTQIFKALRAVGVFVDHVG